MPLFKAWSEDKLNKKFVAAEKFAELVSKGRRFCFLWRVGDLTLLESLTGGAFDRLNWQHSGEFDQFFSKNSNAPRFAWGGGGKWAVLELTGTLSCILVWRESKAETVACTVISRSFPRSVNIVSWPV